MNLRNAFKIIQKRRRGAALVFALIFGLVLIATFALPKQYLGSTKVIIEKVEPSDLTGGRFRATSYDPEFYSTQFQLIKSRAVAQRVVEKLSLVEKYGDHFGIAQGKDNSLAEGFWWGLKKLIVSNSALNSQEISPAEKQEAGFWTQLKNRFWSSSSENSTAKDAISPDQKITNEIHRNIRVQPIENSRIINIGFLSTDPEIAAMVANATVRSFIEESLDLKMEASRRTLEWLTKKADSEKTAMENAQKALQHYTGESDILTLENRLAVTPGKLAEISTQMVRAESRRKELQAVFNQVKGLKNNPERAETVPAVMSNTTLQALRTQIVSAEQSVMELSGKYGEKHPLMSKAQGDLYLLKRKKNQEILRIIHSIENDYELARSIEMGLKNQFDAAKAEAFEINKKYVTYEALKREVDTNRQLYDALILKIKEQGITEEHQPVSVLIVEEAQPPQKPYKPVVPLNLLLGGFVGLFGAIGFAFLYDHLDNTIRTVDETEGSLGAPVLGVVSRCKQQGISAEKVVLNRPLSPLAESYKALRTAILLSPASEPPKKILITSSIAGEGKTTISVNLAIALAQSGSRVLLIDSDLRKPRIHKVLGLSDEKGLSTYLAGISGSEVQKGPVPNLLVMTAGPIPPNPSELLMSKTINVLLDMVGKKFDIILFDSSPILAVADAHPLARLFDSTILVARARKTTNDLARKSLKLLTSVGANVLGVIINAQEETDEHYYYTKAYYGAQTGEETPLIQRAAAPAK
ncbi:MAG: polysaccharide biosynthesis tyrosine autokinase [Deltaproteobacteria bacterium]|nr:polysaccharide biosynthesis tyrosine autokinase [Deltaproteobacteria bacterium]